MKPTVKKLLLVSIVVDIVIAAAVLVYFLMQSSSPSVESPTAQPVEQPAMPNTGAEAVEIDEPLLITTPPPTGSPVPTAR